MGAETRQFAPLSVVALVLILVLDLLLVFFRERELSEDEYENEVKVYRLAGGSAFSKIRTVPRPNVATSFQPEPD
jgi:hypothetical protein